jgi:hypothetical protein
MRFDPTAYGKDIAALLALDGNGQRLMPLAMGRCCSEQARRHIQSRTAKQLFPNARAPEAAVSGLYLYFSCLEEAHEAAQNVSSTEGSYWHGIMHRQEPDAGNSAYWFRRVGAHPIFPGLLESAAEIAKTDPAAGLSFSKSWDPFAFIDLCERARQASGSPLEGLALEIQRAEWQILFDYCAAATRRL